MLVYFNEPINQTTLTSASFRLASAGPDNRLGTADDVLVTTGNISYRDTLNAAVLSFPSPLPLGVYQAVISSNVTDLANNALAKEYRWTFAILAGGANDDDDGDGLTNAQELELAAIPWLPIPTGMAGQISTSSRLAPIPTIRIRART